MSIKRYCSPENNFVVSKVWGELNDANLGEHVVALNELAENMPTLRELGDCTEISDMSKLTAVGTANAAKYDVCRPQSRLALLVDDRALVYGMARAYQTFAEDKRLETQIFTSRDEALEWLAEDAEDLLRLMEFTVQSLEKR